MAGYSTEAEFGRNRMDERLTKHVMGPRAHRVPHTTDQMPENSTGYLDFRGYKDLQHTLHVHNTGLTLQKAQKLADVFQPGYQVVGLRSCDPTIDDEGNPGSFIILRSKGFGVI
jgi:hypothetical protein